MTSFHRLQVLLAAFFTLVLIAVAVLLVGWRVQKPVSLNGAVTVEASDPRPSARHEQRMARDRDLAHITSLRRVPLINVDLLSIHIQAPAEWRLDCVATSVLFRPRERHSVVTPPERKCRM